MELIIPILAAAIRAGTPIFYATLGEIFAERSGVLNLGLEGIMLVGALTGFMVARLTGDPWLGVTAGLLAGGILSLIHAILSISLRAEQIVSGLALAIFGVGLSGFLGRGMVGKTVSGLPPLPLPILSDIPFLGPIFFRHDILVYISFLLAPLAWLILYKTKPGLDIRSVGESPETADALGVSIPLVRYLSVFVGGLMAGVGGAYLSLVYTPLWTENMTAGRGWIAIALVIFAGWHPLKAVIGSYLFGGVNALQLRIQAVGTSIPAHLLMMTPYIFTLLVLVIATREKVRRRMGAPAALGIPFVRGEKG